MKMFDISRFLTLQAGYSQLFQPDCNRHELRGQVMHIQLQCLLYIHANMNKNTNTLVSTGDMQHIFIKSYTPSQMSNTNTNTWDM